MYDLVFKQGSTIYVQYKNKRDCQRGKILCANIESALEHTEVCENGLVDFKSESQAKDTIVWHTVVEEVKLKWL